MERLTELYWEKVQEEGYLEVETFLEQVKNGEHGEVSVKEIDDFIDEMLATMLSNIQLKATEAPHLEIMRSDVEKQTEERMARLKAKYGSG